MTRSNSKPLTTPDSEGQRLSKRLAEMLGCSRREAELYIEGGFVSVDGQMVDVPQFRVTSQRIELAPQAKPEPAEPVTLLIHKAPGHDALAEQLAPMTWFSLDRRWAADRASERPLRKHFMQQLCVTPMETGASGLVVFTQDFRIKRKLTMDAWDVEQELMVEVNGEVTADTLDYLNRARLATTHPTTSMKVSRSSQNDSSTGLRFAVKGYEPGLIADRCERAHLHVTGMKRLRIGRMSLAGLPPDQWRYLMPYERF